MAKLRTVFMGSDEIALPFLSALWEDAGDRLAWAGVFTQPDRRSGRGMKLQASPVKEWALQRGLPVRQPTKCGPEDLEWLRASGVELIFVMAYGQILRESLFGLPRCGALNLHASLLPRYRGASPINTAIAAGESRTGVTLMRIVKALDAGPVADYEEVPVDEREDTPSLRRKIAAACIPLVMRNLDALSEASLEFVEQDSARASYCRIIEKDDADIDVRAPAEVLDRRIRALHPWPGTRVALDGLALRIGAAKPVAGKDPGCEPGRLEVVAGKQLLLHCGAGKLEILQLQKPGGRMLPAPEFLRGMPGLDGQRVERRDMRALVSSQPFAYRSKGRA